MPSPYLPQVPYTLNFANAIIIALNNMDLKQEVHCAIVVFTPSHIPKFCKCIHNIAQVSVHSMDLKRKMTFQCLLSSSMTNCNIIVWARKKDKEDKNRLIGLDSYSLSSPMNRQHIQLPTDLRFTASTKPAMAAETSSTNPTTKSTPRTPHVLNKVWNLIGKCYIDRTFHDQD